MGVDLANYHGWQGPIRSPWRACLAIVRVALLQVFRRKSYWFVLAMGLLQFVLYWSIIYAVTQMSLPEQMRRGLLANFGFAAKATDVQDSAYVSFMQRQSVVTMILLAFSGSLLVGADFRGNALPFYLSRRIDRRHYIVGKLLAVSCIVAIMTTIPALALFVEFSLFTDSASYWSDNLDIVGAILAYGLVLCVVLSVLLTSLSAWLQRAAPIAITWASLFVLLGTIAKFLRDATNNDSWKLLDPWRDIRFVGQLLFGTFKNHDEYLLAWKALAILTVVCLIALGALVHRVRAVEVVD